MSVIEKKLAEEAARIVGEALPIAINWAIDRLRSGSDASAELKAMFRTGDLIADEAERAKFGG